MSPRLVRVLVLAALTVPAALLLSPAQAQFGRPGGRPGGFGGMPQPPAPPGGFRGGMPGGGGLTQHEWVCSGCGKVIGRGAMKPVMPSCPFCGVKFSNGMDIEIDRPGFPRPGGGNVPPTAPPNNPPPEDPAPPADNWPPPDDNPPVPANNNAAPAPVPAADSASTATRTVLMVAAIGGGFLFLFAAIGTFLYITAARAAREDVPQRRRKRVYHDEDD